MNALVLNGSVREDPSLEDIHRLVMMTLTEMGIVADSILLWEKKIVRCTGCFGCWTKTPGVCVIDDFGREVARKAVQSDLIIYLTPITFGGYSSELKKAVDRFSCPMLLPFFTKVGDEVHHEARYEPLPSLIGIGVLPSPEGESERIFTKLVERNAINLHSPAAQSAVYYSFQNREQIGEGVRSLLRKVRK